MYIQEKPVRAGIVEQPEDYTYSSARNHASLDTVLKLIYCHLHEKRTINKI
jgi:hypothetical protein